MSSRPCTSRQSSQSSQASQSSQSPSGQSQSIIYKAVMTPIIFVSFLVSLAWVEFRYSVLRSHSHENNSNSSSNSSAEDCRHPWMPSWLHNLVYRRQDYQYVVVRKNETGKADPEKKNERYYHSMQHKLLKMESDEAFRIRTTVLAIMAGGAAVAVWGTVAGVRWLSWVLA